MKVTSKGHDPNLGKEFEQQSSGLVIGRARSSRQSSGAEPSKYQDLQQQFNEQELAPKLPPRPMESQFATKEEYEEALAGWTSRVGRILGLKVGKKTEA